MVLLLVQASISTAPRVRLRNEIHGHRLHRPRSHNLQYQTQKSVQAPSWQFAGYLDLDRQFSRQLINTIINNHKASNTFIIPSSS